MRTNLFYGPLASRFGHLALALAAVGGMVAASRVDDPPPWPTTAVIGGVLVYVGVRGALMRVACESDRIRVRGLLYSRSIPIQQITSVTPFPALTWRSRSGRSRWTPMSALITGPSNPDTYRSRNDDAVQWITLWVDDRKNN